MRDLAIGVDVGGTKTAAGLVDADGRVLDRKRAPTPAQEPSRVVQTIADLVGALRGATAVSVSSVGIAIPGQYDAATGTFLRIANLALRGFPFRDRLTESLADTLTGRLTIENDTNAAALGEWFGGSGRGCRDFAYVAIGTGIGAGIIVDGRLLRGAHGSAGEIGHTVVKKDGPRCPCGNRGCLELYASGGALTVRATAVAREEPDSLLARLGQNGRSINAGDLFAAADQGDEASRRVVDEAVHYLAVGINNIVELFDPEVVSIGGGMSQVGESLFGRLREALRRQRPGSPDVAPRIVSAVLGEDAGIVGAASAARLQPT